MEAANGRRTRPLIDIFRAAPHRFDPRQAVLLLEQAVRPGRTLAAHAEQDVVRLRGGGGAAFPASDVAAVETNPAGGPATLLLEGFSLGGAHGPLPGPLGRLAAERARAGDVATRDFLDIFQHRLLSLRMLHGKLLRPSLQARPPAETNLAEWVFATLGLASAELRPALQGMEGGLLAAAALLARRPVSLHALERLLMMRVGADIRAVPRQGAWLMLAPAQHSVLGRRGANRRLGRDAVLGTRVWDQQAGLRLDIGPITLPRARDLLPQTLGFTTLGRLARFALGDGPALTLRLRVNGATIPPCRLTRATPPALGWTAWLGGRPRSAEGRIDLTIPQAEPPID